MTSSTDGRTYTHNANGDPLTETAGAVTIHYAYNCAGDLTPLVTVRVTGQGSLTDDVDYPNCPTVTVTWSYLKNGVLDTIASVPVALAPNNLLQICKGRYSATYTASSGALFTGNTLAGQVLVDVGGAAVDVLNPYVSVSATADVAPYLALRYGPGGLQASEVTDPGTPATYVDYDLLGMGGLPQEVAAYVGTSLASAYVYGVGSDRPLETLLAATPYDYSVDGLGSTTSLTDGQGNVLASYLYDGYGNLRPGSMDDVGNPLRFAGLPSDPASGLVYDRARLYDPTTGRFLTPDPLGGGYAYAGDNPVNAVDPSGLAPVMHFAVEGFGAGEGCTMEGYEAGMCGMVTTPPPAFVFSACFAEQIMFGIGVALSVVGVVFGPGRIASWAGGMLAASITGSAAGLSLAVDVGNIMRNGLSLRSLSDIPAFTWILITEFILPSLSWLDAASFIAQMAAKLIPGVEAFELPVAFALNALAYYALVGEGCGLT